MDFIGRSKVAPELTPEPKQAELEDDVLAGASEEEIIKRTSITDIRDACKVKRSEAAIDDRVRRCMQHNSIGHGMW